MAKERGKDWGKFESSKYLLGPDNRFFSVIYITENFEFREPLWLYLSFSISKYSVKHLFLKNVIIE